MRVLVVFAHPRAQSFNRLIMETFVDAVRARGQKLRVRDLYAIKFDPVLTESDLASFRGQAPVSEDVKAEQAHVTWADVIVTIAPVWWIGWPAMLKGWIDRVFALNFAYGYGPNGVIGLLEGRSAIVIGTTGSPAAHWQESGKAEAIRVAQDLGTFELSGIRMMEHLTLSPVGRLTPAEAFPAYLAQVKALVERHL